MSSQLNFSKRIGKQARAKEAQELEYAKNALDAARDTVEMLEARLAKKQEADKLQNCDPNEFRHKAQILKRQAKRKCTEYDDLCSPAVAQEFCADGLPHGIDSVYKCMKRMKKLHNTALEAHALQAEVSYYALKLMNYSDEMAGSAGFIKNWLEVNGLCPEDLPVEVCHWIQSCLGCAAWEPAD